MEMWLQVANSQLMMQSRVRMNHGDVGIAREN
jgi:hypothetical protein